jgi:hypothetical protein
LIVSQIVGKGYFKVTINPFLVTQIDKQKRKEFVDYLVKELNIQHENDWKSVSVEKIRAVKSPKMKLIEIMSIVQEFFPSINLNDFRNINYKKSQAAVKSMLQSLFPGEGGNIYCYRLSNT